MTLMCVYAAAAEHFMYWKTVLKKENQYVGEFLDSMPVLEFHFGFFSNEKYLLPKWSSKRSLYHLYIDDWCKF